MKGDFTRSTFRPEKHYTSVRMQQGRLQLDSDWNEQVDIQAYLYRTQTIDLIGAESGVPTSGGDTGQPNLDSFKVNVTSEFKSTRGSEQVTINDLMIEPGHLYVNGMLCELSGTVFNFQLVSQPSASETQGSATSNRITVSTLNVDGHKLDAGQWLEITTDLPPNTEKLYQIIEIDAQKLELILSKPISEIKGKMRRRLTYQMQPDYPNPETVNNGFYLAYLDVWQRHITAIDDPGLREVALINTPDTTTRTKTLWQLKLQKLDPDQEFELLLSQAIASNQAKDELRQLLQQLLRKSDSAEQKTLRQRLKKQFRKELTAPSRQTFRRLVNISLRRSFKSLLSRINASEIDKKLLRQQFRKLLTKTDSTSIATALRQQFEQLPDAAISTGSKTDLLTMLDQWLKAVNDSSSQRIELRQQFRKWLNQTSPSGQDNTIVQNYEKLLDRFATSEADQEKLVKQLQPLLKQAADSAQQRSAFRKRLRQYLQDHVRIKAVWQQFLTTHKERTAYMNACAGLCPTSGNPASNSSGYRRLENQLYRVEIHDSGQVEAADVENSTQPKATFKWSRDNGSVVSAIEKIQDNVITIRRTSHDIWTTSKSGQWIELTTEEMELKGEPGILAPLVRASDTKIEFNRSRVVGSGGTNHLRALDSFSDQKFTKVRRWDQMTQTPTLLTRSEWIELDGGIKIKFDKASQLETGDYWLIPARSATNDIEWPNDQAEQGRQPLAQPRLGIQHDYCLLAVVEVKDGKFQAQVEDHRFIFPPLVRCLDTAGGTIAGDLNVEGMVRVGTKSSASISKPVLEVVGTAHAETVQAKKLTGDELEVANSSVLNTLQLKNGVKINEFSSDILLRDNSGEAVPTEQAVRTYIDGKISQVETALEKKADTTYVDRKISEVQTALNAKASFTYVDGQIREVRAALDTKANSASVDQRFGQVQDDLNKKADLTGVNQRFGQVQDDLNKKANSADVDRRIQDVQNDLNKKADLTGVNQRFGQVQDDLNKKANSADVDRRIQEVRNDLNKKADLTGVNQRFDQIEADLEKKTTQSYVDDKVDDVSDRIRNLRTTKAELEGSADHDFNVKILKADELRAKRLETDTIQGVNVLKAKDITGSAFKQVSSGALKDLIDELSGEEALEVLNSLNPVKFRFKADETQEIHTGFIAEQAHDLLTSADKQTIKILDIVAVLTKAIQDSHATTTQLAETVEKQRHELSRLQEKITDLETLQPSVTSRSLDWTAQPLMSQSFAAEPRSRVSKRSFYSRLKLFFRRLLNGRRKTNRTL